jgi:hypothetical protein
MAEMAEMAEGPLWRAMIWLFATRRPTSSWA